MSKPNILEEKKLWQKKYHLVIGVDEVGRGALAGPVVAGAVSIVGPVSSTTVEMQSLKSPSRRVFASKESVLPTPTKDFRYIDWEGIGIDDSKRLSAKKREELAKIITKHMVWGIGEASVAHINRYGIVKATEKAMRSAIAELSKRSEVSKGSKKQQFLLIDAFYIKYVKSIGLENQKAIIKGDQKSISIAAASIIAKVHRDMLMIRLNKKFKKYYWQQNKGYGTLKHREAIAKHGLTKHHRVDFVD